MATATFLSPASNVEDANDKILSDKKIFISPDENEFEALERTLLSRLNESQGECFVTIGTGEAQSPGLNAEEMEASVATLELLGERLNVSVVFLRDSNGAVPTVNEEMNKKSKSAKEKLSSDDFKASLIKSVQPDAQTGLLVKEFLLRRAAEEQDFVDVRVAVVGNVDAGKSTLLGVLTHGELDNGRGLARMRLFRHKHEMESGRTSSVGNDILGFSSDGGIVNKPVHGQLDWSSICKESAKVVTFIDLAGHERYLKTTVFGMTGHAPDFAMLMVGANAGLIGMTKEHLGLALALTVPVFVVVTKIDMCPPNVLQDTMNLLFKILKSPGCKKLPILVNNHDDVIISATNFTSQRMCPIFAVSNVTGENLDLVKKFINLLTPRSDPQSQRPPEFQIDEVYTVQGVGTVVSGTCLCGEVRVNDNMLLGPDPTGNYALVPVKSIQRKRLPVVKVSGGQTASFALKKVKRNQLRKGMVLLSPTLEPFCCLVFQAEVLILHHPTTICVGYQAMVHVGPVRQTATIISITTKERLRTGDKDIVVFKFIRQPEFMKKGVRLIFREGKTKAVGTVTEVTPYVPKAGVQTKQKQMKKQTGRRQKVEEGGTAVEESTTSASTAKEAVTTSAAPVVQSSSNNDEAAATASETLVTDISKLSVSARRHRKTAKPIH